MSALIETFTATVTVDVRNPPNEHLDAAIEFAKKRLYITSKSAKIFQDHLSQGANPEDEADFRKDKEKFESAAAEYQKILTTLEARKAALST